MCSCDDAESLRASAVTWPVARKSHLCEECGRVIARGTKHRRVTGIDPYGVPFSSRACPTCLLRGKAFADAEGCHAPLGVLLETIRECGAEDPDFWPAYRKALKEERAAARGGR